RDEAIDALLPQLEALGNLADMAKQKGTEHRFVTFLREMKRFVADVRHRETVAPRDHDGLEAELRAFLHRMHWDWSYEPPRWITFEGKSPEEVGGLRQSTLEAISKLVQRADADLAACLQEELRPVVELYEKEKERAGKLDFVDLLLRTRDLIRSNDAVRRSL